jgi:transposase, IS30 family
MMDYTRLSMRERCNLATFLDMGLSISAIAKRLDRHRSTIYRELSRNQAQERYRPGLAHEKAKKRRPRKAMKLQSNQALYHYVYSKLKQGWSPEQIVGRMRLRKKSYDVCHETIYRYIYLQRKKGLYQYLPTKKLKRQKRYVRKVQRCRYGDIRLIEKRPKKIEARSMFGHWEGDLIAFKNTKRKTVTTLVERKTRMVFLLKNTTKTSFIVMSKIKNHFIETPEVTCKTITFDQGTEFADYQSIEKQMCCKVYYCNTRSPWQKGSNENMNGRLRRYLPRDIDISQVNQKELDQLANKMNTLPRKCLGFKTPKELFLKHHKKTCRTEN